MNQKTKEFRQNLADIFIKSLPEKQLEWKQGWNASGNMQVPVNAYTGKPYKGINRMYLWLCSAEKGSADNRWATFRQIQQKGWHLKKGSKGCRVEYWQPYDFVWKSPIDWNEYHRLRGQEGIGLIAKYYVVFNGKDIEGIPKLPEQRKNKTVLEDALIEKISSGMGVPIFNDGGNRAFYSTSSDTVHLPAKEAFHDSYEYNAAALHELSHASGAPNRLNRSIKNVFGSDKYAYEELVAEISACFMAEHLEIAQTEKHIENHKSYVQSWISEIQKNPDVLVRAVRDAGFAADYLELHAGILTQKEYLENTRNSPEVPQDIIQENPEDGPAVKKITAKHRNPIELDLKKMGYKPDARLINKISRLNQITGKEHTVRDIHAALQEHKYRGHAEADKLLNSIGSSLKKQEMAIRPAVPFR